MKVLQVNCVYKSGSTGKIVYDVHTELIKAGVESVVCYGRGEAVQEENVYKTCGELYSKINHFIANIRGVMHGGCFLSTYRLISVIKKERPDIVHLHCINGYFVNIYRLINRLKKNKVKTVLTLHAEFMYTGGCGYSVECSKWTAAEGCAGNSCPRLKEGISTYFRDATGVMWKKMNKAFKGFNEDLIVTSVSPWLMERAARSAILKDKRHRVVFNGLDNGIFRIKDSQIAEEIRKELGVENERVFFHATSSFTDVKGSIKGGYYIIELAKMMPEVKFVVAGAYKEGIKVPDNMILLGRIEGQERLAQLYSMADLTVITSMRETFSMITAESLSCGTPVAGFKAGAPEMIALEKYSRFTEQGDLIGLKKAAEELLSREFNARDIEEAAKIYSKRNMTENYIKVYQELMD